MTHEPPKRFELDPKITEAEIAAATHDLDEHIGESEHFSKLLSLLVSLKSFGENVPANFVPHLMYEESSHREPTTKQAKSGKKDTYWGNRRFEKIRYGRASFTRDEAQYFYDAFLRVFGESIASHISLESLILSPLSETLNTVQNAGQLALENLDPIQQLRILEAAQPEDAARPILKIQKADNFRISQQSEYEPKITAIDTDELILPAGTEYWLYVEQPSDDTKVLIFEFAEKPFQVEGVEEPVQAQLLQAYDPAEQIQLVGALDSKPLKVLDHEGKFGFCAISYPAEWDAGEVFGLAEGDWNTTERLQEIVKNIRSNMPAKKRLQLSGLKYSTSKKIARNHTQFFASIRI